MKYGLSEKQLNEIITILSTFTEIEEAILFGSRTIDTYKEASDVDIALKGDKVTASLAAKLKYQLEEDTYLPFFFDFVAYTTITNEALKEHIDTKGVSIYRAGWRECKLGDVSSKIGSGATPTGGENAYKSAGISLIRSQNVYDFTFSNGGLAFIDDNQAYELRNVEVLENDILINITGESVTRCCIVPKQYLPARVTQHVSIIRPIKEIADFRFVFYYLQSIKPELHSIAEIGCTRRALTKGMLEYLSILLPPLPEQRAIASVLSSLDDKIDLLHRQNKTLEVMAETLFRQWFMEEADDGWEEGKLEDIALFFNGKSRPSEGGSIPIYGGNGILGCTNVSNYSGKSIIVGRVGAYCGSLYFESRDIWVSDNALLVKPKNKNQTHYLFYLLKTLDLNSMAEGSSHPLLTQTLLKSIDITLPSKEKIIDFDNQLEQWTTKTELNRSQIHILEKIRGTLLPKLMSGEIKINTDNVIPVRGGQNENRTY